MALRRMVPTNYFKDPDILNLKNREHRQVLLGLILFADDEGREIAHTGLLSREMGDYTPEEIEVALQDLVDNDLVLLYQVGRHRYYWLTRWNRWQTINPNKMAPSKYPPPPQRDQAQVGDHLEDSGESLEDSGESLPQFKRIQFKRIQEQMDDNSEQKAAHIIASPADNAGDFSEEIISITTQLAPILHLPTNPVLMRVVSDYHKTPGLRLIGEADAAREWIDDQARNRRGQHMTPAFFRRWLKRELEAVRERLQATGTDGLAPVPKPRPPERPASRGMPPSLMGLERTYLAAMEHGGGGDKSSGSGKSRGGEA